MHESYVNVIPLCQLSFETQSPQILSTMLLGRKVVQMRDDALDIFLLGYCIANSENTTIWDMNLNEYSFEPDTSSLYENTTTNIFQ